MTTGTVRRSYTPKSRMLRRALVAAGAVLAAVMVWTIAVVGLDLRVTVPETPGSPNRRDLQFGSVLSTAVVATVAGWALLALLERITSRARTIWTAIAVTVLLLTLPYLPGFTATERVVIALIHLTLAAILITGLRRTGRSAG
ncbi:MAG: DUF6069 family protein [Pseudonocardiaceae bacterium]